MGRGQIPPSGPPFAEDVYKRQRHGGGQAAYVDIVLDHKGDAVERPPEGTLSRFRVAALRFLKRRRGDAQHGVEGAVMEADSLKGVPDERRRGQFPRAQRGCGLCDGDGIQRIDCLLYTSRCV